MTKGDCARFDIAGAALLPRSLLVYSRSILYSARGTQPNESHKGFLGLNLVLKQGGKEERERRQFGAGLEDDVEKEDVGQAATTSLGDRYLTCKFIPSAARAATAAALLPVAS